MKDFMLPFEYFFILHEDKLKQIHKKNCLKRLPEEVLKQMLYVGDNWEEYLKQVFTQEYVIKHMEGKYDKYSKKDLEQKIIDLTSNKDFEIWVLDLFLKLFG